MNLRLFHRACAGLFLVGAVLNAQTARPIENFLTAQGQTSTFFPPVPDYLGWSQALCISGGLSCISRNFDPTRFCFGNFALVDYAGLADKYIVRQGGQSSGTAIDGAVIERPVSASAVKISVTLHTRNAITFALGPSPLIPGTACGTGIDFAGGPLLFGERINKLPTPADRALAESFLQITFINPIGAPLPDLADLLFNRYPDVLEFSFTAVASGPLRAGFGVPDGTPGVLTIAQAANGARSNFQPAIVNLREVRR